MSLQRKQNPLPTHIPISRIHFFFTLPKGPKQDLLCKERRMVLTSSQLQDLRHQKGFWPYRQLLQSMESTIIEPGLKFWGSQANQLNLHLKMWGKTSSSCLYFSGTYTVKKGYQLIMETLIKIQTTIQTKGKFGKHPWNVGSKAMEAIQQEIGRGITSMMILTKADKEAPYNLERFNPRRRHQSLERCRKINRLHCSQWFANGSYWKMG